MIISRLRNYLSWILCCLLICWTGSLQAGRQSISFLHLGAEQGLPQGTVNVIFQDAEGYIWLGTYAGLARFDGYQFKSWQHDPDDPQSLSNNIVVDILLDKSGYLWVATAQNGVNRLDIKSGKFTRFLSSSDDFDSLSNPQVNALHQDQAGRIWVGTNHGLNLYLPEKNAFAHFYNNPLDVQSLPLGSVVDIIDSGTGDLWVATTDTLSYFNVKQQVFQRFDRAEAPTQINRLWLDVDNSVWIGTRSDGLFHYRPNLNKFEQFVADSNQPGQLSFNDVRAILRDKDGNLWVGTEEGGLNVRRKGEAGFRHFQRNTADPHSLSLNDIWSLYQDRSGLLWVGTAGGGIDLTLSFGDIFSRLTHSPHDEQSLSHEYVTAMREDELGFLWLTTLGGLDRYDPGKDQFIHYSHFANKNNIRIGTRLQAIEIDNGGHLWLGNQRGQLFVFDPETTISKLIHREAYPPGFVSSSRVRLIQKDRSGHLWVALDDGLLKIDIASQQIIQDFKFAEQGQLGDATIRSMMQDDTGIIWFGSWNSGLQRYDPEFGSLQTLANIPGDPKSISNNTILSLYQDQSRNIWVGTFSGLNFLSAEKMNAGEFDFVSFDEKDELPNSSIHGIAGDSNGHLWLSTNKGISEFDPDSKTFVNYDTEDGLTANEFNTGAVLRSQQGDIYFGGVSGISIVTPGRKSQAKYEPPIHITKLEFGDDTTIESPALNSLHTIDNLHNDLKVEFTALDYRHPSRNLYRYRLRPLRQQWIEQKGLNSAIFTNLDPGRYTFELQASNSDGRWSDKTVSIRLDILPPLWQTWWAYLIYALLVVVLFAWYLRNHAKKLEEQRAMNEHLLRVDRLKDEFLANTSHELRTPLNGIIGIAESLKEGVAGLQNQQTINHLQLIIDGGKRLAQLVNDILDFKKLTHQNLVLQRRAVDLNTVSNVVLNLLKPLADEKKLQLINSIPSRLPLVYADENRLQQILHNLVGNAIKYTQKGLVEVTARELDKKIEICVADTGIGIAPDKLDRIFMPFEQATIPQVVPQRGTGLGLSVTQQLVNQHGGRIWVESKPGRGSEFYFELPVWFEQSDQSVELLAPEETKSELPIVPGPKVPVTEPLIGEHQKSIAKILIADDDPVNLQVLTDLLAMNKYEVVQAHDGDQALKAGLENEFDLAILDIMMPGLNGYDVCQRLRAKYSSIELPILLLSARHQSSDITAGFEAGANDYVTKPIEREVLMSRIRTMLMLRSLVEAKQQQEHANTLQQACERLGKYFPRQVARQIITGDASNPLVAKRKQITILFADLAGFTSISDRFEPEDITDILNSFLGKMGQLVEDHGGVLNEILGDGLVVLFGALDNMSKKDQANNAAALALEMQNAMVELASQWLEAGIDHNVKLRIGIHQDYATVGNFGSEDIIAFRAVGSGVNLASRLEGMSEKGTITVSYPIYAQCKENYAFTELREEYFKGFSHAHRVCQLVDKK